MTQRHAKQHDEGGGEGAVVYLDGRQVDEAKKVFMRIWRACDKLWRKNGHKLPAPVFVADNADALEQAAHVDLGDNLTLVCRTMLCDSNDPSKGFQSELVVWEKTGSLVGVSKVAVTYETAAKSWMFFCGLGIHHCHIDGLVRSLGIAAEEMHRRVSKEVDEGIAVGRMSLISHWAIERLLQPIGE